MDINKITKPNQVTSIDSIEKSSKASSKETHLHQSKLIQDNVAINQNNTKLADLLKIKKVIQENNDIRLDKVEQARSNLQNYFKSGKLDGKIIDKLSENLTKVL